MRCRLCLAVVATVVAAAVALVAQASGKTRAPSCSTQAASAAATAAGFDVDPGLKRTPINSVICGPFFGAGSEGMAATVAVPTGCGFSIGWAVFRLTGGAWQLVMKQNNGVLKLESVPLADGGADIRTTQGYPQRGEMPSCAFGPSRMRTQVWHWNQSSFVAGAFAVTLLRAWFVSPRGLSTTCSMGDQAVIGGRGAQVLCESGTFRPRLFQKVTLRGSGAISICRTHRATACKLACGCTEGLPTLNYGQHIDVGRFRCEALRTGIRCTIISTGRGFLLTPARVLRVP